MHGTRDIGRPKVASAKDSIRQINPLVKVETYNFRLTAENAAEIISEYDVVADASDNYPTRYLVNDACVLLDKPDVFGAMYQFEGQVAVYYAKYGPCLRCMYPAPLPAGLVPSCAMGGVVGVLPGVIGTLQAIESLRERQESQLINNDDYGLLKNVADSQRIQTRNGAPTPDDLDELITKVWKEP